MLSSHSFKKAQAVWELFSGRYAQLETEITSKMPSELMVPVDPGKSQILKQALEQGNWELINFNDETMPQIALSLYQTQQITYHQLCTLLERRQTLNNFQLLNTYPILDENNEFTVEARQILLPALNQSRHLKELTKEQELELKELVATLPLSERFFYTTSIGKFKDNEEESLGNGMIANDICALLINQDSEQMIHTSTGLFDAHGLVRFGLDEYIRPLYRFGTQDINDIESGVRQYARLAALCYPNTKAFDEHIHDYDNVTPLEATSHDRYHAFLMSAVPKPILHAFWRIVDVVRSNTKNKWSKEIWTFIDCEMLHCIATHTLRKSTKMSDQEMTELFCHSIIKGSGVITKYSFLLYKNEITPVFITLILDMYRNPHIWAEYSINPKYFTAKFKEFYATIGEIYSHIKDDDYNIQLFKCQLYFAHLDLHGKTEPKLFTNLLDIINKNRANVSSQLTLQKVKAQDKEFPPYKRNTVYLSYAGEKEPQKIYQALIKEFMEKDFIVTTSQKLETKKTSNYANHLNSIWSTRTSESTPTTPAVAREFSCLIER